MTDDDADVALVDDRFWLRRAGELVTAGAALRTDAARQLMSALAWLWTVYTGAAVLGSAAAKADLHGGRAVVVALPSVMLMFAYVTAVFAYMPISVEFDPRDPADVQAAYVAGVRAGQRRLRIALVLCAVAAASIGAAIAVVAA